MGNFLPKKKGKSPANSGDGATSPPTGGATVPTTDAVANFAEELLKAQNGYRSKHQAPAMTLSQALCEAAQKWADHLASDDKLEHSNDRDGAGENLAWSSGSLSGDGTADMWYSEIKDYDFSSPGYNSKTGHFTQLVWKSSTEFGAGFAKAQNGGTYVVGRYLPSGNITNEGQFAENVLPEK